jgi:hypothetical protein
MLLAIENRCGYRAGVVKPAVPSRSFGLLRHSFSDGARSKAGSQVRSKRSLVLYFHLLTSWFSYDI